MKISWLSSTDTSRFESARFTANLLPYLQKHAEITLWVLNEKETKETGEIKKLPFPVSDQIQVRNVVLPECLGLNHSDLTVLNLEPEDPRIFEILTHTGHYFPSLTILHGFELSSFVNGSNLHVRSRMYQNLLGMGKLGTEAASAFVKGFLKREPAQYTEDFLSTQPPGLGYECLKNSLGAVVHTHDASEYLKFMKIPNCQLNSPFSVTLVDSTKAARKQKSDLLQLVAYGCTQEASLQLLEAIAAHPQKNRFNLTVVAELNPTGLDTLLSQADLVFHLPSAEDSFARVSQFLLQAWDHALPCVVPSYGWFLELPPTVVEFSTAPHLAAALISKLTRLLEMPEYFTLLGKNARLRLESFHGYERYSLQLFEFIQFLLQTRTESCEKLLIQRTSRELSGWITTDNPLTDSTSIAEAISFVTQATREKPLACATGSFSEESLPS